MFIAINIAPSVSVQKGFALQYQQSRRNSEPRGCFLPEQRCAQGNIEFREVVIDGWEFSAAGEEWSGGGGGRA